MRARIRTPHISLNKALRKHLLQKSFVFPFAYSYSLVASTYSATAYKSYILYHRMNNRLVAILHLQRWSGRQDFNPQPLDPKSSGLPNCPIRRCNDLCRCPLRHIYTLWNYWVLLQSHDGAFHPPIGLRGLAFHL